MRVGVSYVQGEGPPTHHGGMAGLNAGLIKAEATAGGLMTMMPLICTACAVPKKKDIHVLLARVLRLAPHSTLLILPAPRDGAATPRPAASIIPPTILRMVVVDPQPAPPWRIHVLGRRRVLRLRIPGRRPLAAAPPPV